MEHQITKTCPVCGKEFSTPYFFKKYCSDECYMKTKNVAACNRYKKTRQAPLATKICPVCGKKFETRDSKRVYCSYECGDKAERFRILQSRKRKKNKADNIGKKSESPAQKSKRAQREEKFNRLIDEAEQCGLSYGWYKAQLRLGKTFEELRAAHLASLNQ